MNSHTGTAHIHWTDRAACAGSDTDFWYPTLTDTATNGGPNALVAAARAICHRCPVRTDCLEYALTRNETHGIWGGKTPKERRAERNRRRRAQGLSPL